MKKEWAMKWVAALKGGNFKQTTGMLRRHLDDTCCCLGVLEDLTGCEWKRERPRKNWFISDEGGVNATSLTMRAQKITGIRSNNGDFGFEYKGYSSLMALNDVGISFDEIGDFIKENYKKL